MTFEAKDYPQRQKHHQKWFLHTKISHIRAITLENGVRNKNGAFSNMADVCHIRFGHSAKSAIMVDKHLIDSSSPET